MEHNEKFLLFLFGALLFRSRSVRSTIFIEQVLLYVVLTKNLRKQP